MASEQIRYEMSDFRKCKALLLTMTNNAYSAPFQWNTKNHIFTCKPSSNITYCCGTTGKIVHQYTCISCNKIIHQCDFCNPLKPITLYCFITSHLMHLNICYACCEAGLVETILEEHRCITCHRVVCDDHLRKEQCTQCQNTSSHM